MCFQHERLASPQGAVAYDSLKILAPIAGKSALATDVVGAIVKPIGAQISSDHKVINDVIG